MAIDTQNKRRSALGRVLPVPSGSIAAADRRHALGIYRFGDDEVVVIDRPTGRAPTRPLLSTLDPRGKIGRLPTRPNVSKAQFES